MDLRDDATSLAERIRARELSAREATEAAIARIEALEPVIGALSSRRFEEALDEAKALDAAPLRKASAPFAGVPFLVKDLSMLKGAPLTFGSRLFRDYVSPKTEPLIAAALEAGFIALGKSRTPEFGLISVTEPLLHGPTRNPWDLSLSPGGSSGGACAAVACGMVPFAHASDGGGSIRIPAAACGLVGLKPSRGRGLAPARSGFGGVSVTLCVSRSVRDTARFLAISDAARIARADDLHPGPAEIGYVDAPIDRPLRIALAPKAINGAAPDNAVAAALERAAALCADLGHHVEAAAPVFDAEAATTHFLVLWAALPAEIRRRFALIRAVACRWRVWDWPRYEAALDPWTRGLADWFAEIEAKEPGSLDRARAFFKDVGRIYEAFLRRYDVIMSPVTRRARVPIGEMAPTTPFPQLMEAAVDNVGYTPTHNAIGAPAITLPLGWAEDGLPIGVQFAAARHDERTLLELAYQLEAAAPWADRRPPEPIA